MVEVGVAIIVVAISSLKLLFFFVLFISDIIMSPSLSFLKHVLPHVDSSRTVYLKSKRHSFTSFRKHLLRAC